MRLSGLEPEKDISIEYIGSRRGEKLKEELKATNESISRTNHNKILVLKNPRGVNWDDYIISVNKLIHSAKSYDINIITNEILKCVPEYKPNINNNYNDFADSILSEKFRKYFFGILFSLSQYCFSQLIYTGIQDSLHIFSELGSSESDIYKKMAKIFLQ